MQHSSTRTGARLFGGAVATLALTAGLTGCGGSSSTTATTTTAAAANTSTSAATTSATSAAASTSSAASTSPATSAAGTYTMAQVKEHATTSSCWAAVSGSVYDLTDWIAKHPGGPAKIEQLCGTDATHAFTSQHGGDATPKERLAEHKIGTLA